MTYETSPIMRQMALAFVAIEGATQEAGGKPGFPPAIGLAVSACESGWWKSQTGKNNYFGITRAPKFAGDPGSAWCLTTEYITPAALAFFRPEEHATAVPLANRPGWYSMYRWFAAYPSLEAAVGDYVDLLIRATRYHPSWVDFHSGAHLGDPDAFLRAVCAAGYATGPAFQTEVIIEHQANIQHAVAMARAERQALPKAA